VLHTSDLSSFRLSRSSIPHLFALRAETEKGQLLCGVAPFLCQPDCRTCGKWPEELKERYVPLLCMSCFFLIVLRLPESAEIGRNWIDPNFAIVFIGLKVLAARGGLTRISPRPRMLYH
jgi:hypothetical protein